MDGLSKLTKASLWIPEDVHRTTSGEGDRVLSRLRAENPDTTRTPLRLRARRRGYVCPQKEVDEGKLRVYLIDYKGNKKRRRPEVLGS